MAAGAALGDRTTGSFGSEQATPVLTGQGQMFSAGVNLLRLSEGGAAYVQRFLPALHRLYDTVFFFPKPVVAVSSARIQPQLVHHRGGPAAILEFAVAVAVARQK